MSNIKEVHDNPRLQCLCQSNIWSMAAMYVRRLRRRRRAYAPTINATGHDNHEKINSWVSFAFPYDHGAPLGGPSGRRSSAITAYRKSHSRETTLASLVEQWKLARDGHQCVAILSTDMSKTFDSLHPPPPTHA